tara:strand:- start:254 stop:736 length:483 start_codon:yes stop_codon:yes gene_type:complete
MIFEEKNWNSGKQKNTSFAEIKKIITENTSKGAKVYIGTDSFKSKGNVCFATVVCLHSSNVGGRYFFYKEFEKPNKYQQLAVRITEEVRRSVELAESILDECDLDPKNIELHLDVSPFEKNNSTSKLSVMLKGYVQGAGFDCKVKPNAWASQTVADRHSK